MKYRAIKKILAGTLFLLITGTFCTNAQTYLFRNYGSESSIPNTFIYTLNQADDGFLWLGTGNGISRFDGFTFFNVPYPDSVSGRYATASIRDKNGRIWYGFNDGSVSYTERNHLIAVKLENSNSISDIVEGPDGMIFIIPQGKAVFSLKPDNPGPVSQHLLPSGAVIFSAAVTEDGRIMLGTQENIIVGTLNTDSLEISQVIEGFDYAGVTAIQPTGDKSIFILGTDGGGLYRLMLDDRGHELTKLGEGSSLGALGVQSVMVDDDRSFWISTFGSGIIKISLSEDYKTIISVQNYDTGSGLAANDVKLVFKDIEGNYWIGFYGEGLSVFDPYSLVSFRPGRDSKDNNIIYISGIKDRYLLGTPAGYHIFDAGEGRPVSFTNLLRSTGNTDIASYFLDPEDNLWIGTEGNGLYVRNGSGQISLFYRSGDNGVDNIRDIIADKKNVWLATTNGVIVLDRKSRQEKRRFDINNGLSHNSINKLMAGKDGRIYIGTESPMLYMIDDKLELFSGDAVMQGSMMNKILSSSQDAGGAIWTATLGNGVFKCLNDSVVQLSRADDLLSNYCYSILADSDNKIWIGHEKGFSVYDTEAGFIKSYGTGFSNAGVCNPGALIESADRKILIGTSSGLLIFDKGKDNTIGKAPLTSINHIAVNDVIYDYQPVISLPYSKRNQVTISYSGIDFSSPDEVYYSTYLENFDDEWSRPGKSREVTYNLSDGDYRFNLAAFSKTGSTNDKPVSFEIRIHPPFWRSWWFILLTLAALTGTVVFIIREREKSQKKVQEYLEKELEARTSVVMKQKAEIELQNIAITDSINYAKRIQSSILPDINKLRESFRDAFILFHPRDIVSGDFYWFDRIGDDKFVLVCADSTGHGVPGAFMSMIGSTLLRDIVTRQRITRPSEVLKLLDEQIFSTLNQNVELGISNDGMDMVVCEFNISKRHVRFASAMRPVIIVLDGESFYIKGNRSSVGGESVIEKYYDDQEYYMSEGDTIYLFSDGLPDQFGGSDGKKMKIARLKKIIEDVSNKPMEEQMKGISKFFFDWKGSYDQVDDVLLMGIKV